MPQLKIFNHGDGDGVKGSMDNISCYVKSIYFVIISVDD